MLKAQACASSRLVGFSSGSRLALGPYLAQLRTCRQHPVQRQASGEEPSTSKVRHFSQACDVASQMYMYKQRATATTGKMVPATVCYDPARAARSESPDLISTAIPPDHINLRVQLSMVLLRLWLYGYLLVASQQLDQLIGP